MPFGTNIKPAASDLVHLEWLERQGLHDFKGKRCMDLGCGSGFLSERQITEGAALAVGIDVAPVAFPPAETRAKQGPFYLQADLNSASWLPPGFRDGQVQGFNLITAFNIIEHLDSPWLFIKASRSLLGPGGRLIISSPNAVSWQRWTQPKRWLGGDPGAHKVLFTPYTLRFLLEGAGFDVLKLEAPVRQFGRAGRVLGPIGAQILAVAQPGAVG